MTKIITKTISSILTIGLTMTLLTACSQQQVIGGAVAVVKIPTKAAGAVAGTAGGFVGGTVGGLVAGDMGHKYGKMAGQAAGEKAIP